MRSVTMGGVVLENFAGCYCEVEALLKRVMGRRAPIVAGCLLLLLAIGFWLPWLMGGRVPVPADQQSWMLPWAGAQMPVMDADQWQAWWWDGVAQFYPWRVLTHRWLQRGEWPLWSDQQFTGYPFAANSQSALFYPPNWVHVFVHPKRALIVLAALHHALAGLLTFWFCRALKLGTGPALFAAIAYAFGGPMVGLVPLPSMMYTAAWLPGCLLGVEYVFRRGSAISVAGLGMAVGMAILAGHLQICAYILLATAAYALFRVIHGIWHRRTHVGGLIAGGAIGVAIGCSQLLPAAELARMSPRFSSVANEQTYRFHQKYALKPAELITFVDPFALGHPNDGDYPLFNYGERIGYTGAITLLFAALGLILSRRWWRWWLGLSALLILWTIMGGPPSRVLFFAVPMVGLAGGFVRLLFVFTLCVAILAAIGLDAVSAQLLLRCSGRKRLLGAVVSPVMATVLCAQLFAWALPTVPSVAASRLYPKTGLIEYLQRNWRAGDRMLAVTPRANWSLNERPDAVLPPNSATAYEKLSSIQGYDSVIPINYYRLAAHIEGSTSPAPAANGNMVLLENTDSDLLRLCGVRWIVRRAGRAVEPAEEMVAEIEGVRVQEVEGALTRAFLTEPRGDAVGGISALQRLAASEPEPLHVDPGDGCNCLTVSVPARESAARLVVTNTYYPGWRVWVDDRRGTVSAVGNTFQSVELPPAESVRAFFAFWPGTVVCGLFVMLVACGTGAGLMGFGLMSARRQEDRR